MKKLNKLFIFIIMTILGIIVMPANVFASELITEVRLTMNTIEAGNDISFTATVEATPAAALDTNTISLNWCKSDKVSGGICEAVTSGKFEVAQYYAWSFLPGTFESGYETDSSTKYYVNDEEVTYLNLVMACAYITEFRFTGPEIRDGNAIPSTINIASTPESGIKTNTLPVNWFKSDNPDTTELLNLVFGTPTYETGNFEAGKYYYFNNSGVVKLNKGYLLSEQIKYYYNDVKIFDMDGANMVFTWLEAEDAYSYEYISGNNQKFDEGKISSYTYKIDGDNLLFETIKINGEEFVKDTDYTVTKGSTIITFTTTGINKLNSLKSGTYTVETKFSSNTVTGKLVINEENPQTSDNITLYIILGFISLISITGCGLYLKKRNN